MIEPTRDRVAIKVLPTDRPEGLIVRVETENVMRKVEVLALGPDANRRFQPEDQLVVGDVCLANILTAQQFGEDDEFVVPVGALMAKLTEAV